MKRGGGYFPVVLSCDPEEHYRRVIGVDREINHKLIDVATVGRLREDTSLVDLNPYRNYFKIDVTRLSPASAADAILDRIESGAG